MRALLCVTLFSFLAIAQTAEVEQLFRNALEAQQRGDFAVAVLRYQQALKIQPDLIDARANLGAALVHLGRFDESIDAYRSALKLDPGNQPIRLNLSLAFYKKGDFQAAANEFASLYKANSGNMRVATLLGDCDARLGHPDQAVALLTPLQAAHPDDMDLTYVLGSALVHTGSGRNGAALLEKVGQSGNSGDAYMLAGSALLALNDFERARNDLDAALRIQPSLPGLHALCGEVRDKTGDRVGAEGEFRKALAANPDDFKANLYLGAIQYKKRETENARTYLAHAVALNPSSSMARYELALVESTAGQLVEAAAELERVELEDPTWLEPHVQLAFLYYKLHRPEQGSKERDIVNRLTSEQQKRGPGDAYRP